MPLTLSGTAASSMNPETWATFRAASVSSIGAGLGFVLNGDGIVCIDIDHCIVGGRPTRAAETFLASLPPTFIEVSPSGDGLHVWGTGRVERGRRTKHAGLWLEVYGTGRYITVTGVRFRNSPAVLADLSSALVPIV